MTVLSALGQFAELLNRAVGGYQTRVKDGLISTGDELTENVHPTLKKLMELYKANATVNIREEFEWHYLDYSEHYCRKWEADRKRLK